jgi:hypothetical protein
VAILNVISASAHSRVASRSLQDIKKGLISMGLES